MKEIELKKWVNIARWAPSGGNSQPWKLRVENLDNGELVLFVDPQYRQKPSCMDLDGSSTLMGLGAFIESLSLIVEFDNHFLQIDEICCTDRYFDFSIKFRIIKGSHSNKDERFISSIETFSQRVTNRTRFLSTPIPHDFQEFIDVQAKRLNLSIKNLSDPENRSQLIQNFENLERIRWENKVFLSYLLDELKETTNEENSKGIPFYQLDLKSSEIFLLQIFKKFPFTRSFLPWGASQIIAKEGVQKPLSKAIFFCYLVGKEYSAENLFNQGRCLQRIWLAAEEKGMALQPMANHLIVSQALRFPKKFDLNLQKKMIINSVYQNYQECWGIDILEQPLFGFRVGYPSAKMNPSSRRPVGNIINF